MVGSAANPGGLAGLRLFTQFLVRRLVANNRYVFSSMSRASWPEPCLTLLVLTVACPVSSAVRIFAGGGT